MTSLTPSWPTCARPWRRCCSDEACRGRSSPHTLPGPIDYRPGAHARIRLGDGPRRPGGAIPLGADEVQLDAMVGAVEPRRDLDSQMGRRTMPEPFAGR